MQQAFVLRINPGHDNRVQEALESDELIIGWSYAKGLLNPELDWWQFREIVRSTYYAEDDSMRRAGAAAGHLWRFIRDMREGDLVVVPDSGCFYVARVTGDADYRAELVEEDGAYRRPVEWLNGKRPIPRTLARAALISRMKIHGTSAWATDLLGEIQECLELASKDEVPDFHQELQANLVTRALADLHNGRLDPRRFEELISHVLLNQGAKEARVIPTSVDRGADVVATFRLADTFEVVVAVQAKHWQPYPPVSAREVEQLIAGMEAEGADLGMVVTTGSYSDEALRRAQLHSEETGKRIELVDGEQFAKMLIEHGLNSQGAT